MLLPRAALAAVLVCLAACVPITGAGNVGVNYGVLGNNLPTPTSTAKLVLSTSLRNVKLYNADPATLQAFANTGVKLIVSAGNDDIPLLAASVAGAQAWVQSNVAAYMPATQIVAIALGNEVLMTAGSTGLAGQLVGAILNVHTALVNLKLDSAVKVSSPQSLGVLQKSYPPSSGAFQDQYVQTFKDLLSFHQQTASPLMLNAYPYFAYIASPANVSVAYALFQSNAGITDANSGLHYTNILDAQLDAVYSAMARLGYHDVNVLVSETGWPSAGDPTEIGASIANAQQYNGNLIKHITSTAGTPLRPNASFDAYIFALFNENLKPGPSSERNYGLFNADETPVYNVGLTAGSAPPTAPAPSVSVAPPTQAPPLSTAPTAQPPITLSPPPPTIVVGSPAPSTSAPPPSASLTPPPASPTGFSPPPLATPGAPSSSPGTGPQGRTWCVAKTGAPQQDMLNALNYACGQGLADCSAIQPGANCYNPNTLAAHATWAFNEYYQQHGHNYWNCYFNATAIITITDPSYAGCTFS